MAVGNAGMAKLLGGGGDDGTQCSRSEQRRRIADRRWGRRCVVKEPDRLSKDEAADAAVAANLYSAREWEELDEEPIRERRPRRRAASR